MIRGLYSSTAGMLCQIEHQDVIANNLANSNTAGFKRSAVSQSAFTAEFRSAIANVQEGETGNAKSMIPFLSQHKDHAQGLLQDASALTNLAIDGPGSFVARTPHGDQLVRGGNFSLNSLGQIVTNEGHPLMGQNGPITVSGADWSVDSDANVRVNGLIVDRLRIEQPEDLAGNPILTGRVVQGKLEHSNVNIVQEMVAMITAVRAYEAGQRAIQALDDTLDKAINHLGRTA